MITNENPAVSPPPTPGNGTNSTSPGNGNGHVIRIERAYHGYFDPQLGHKKLVLCNVDLRIRAGEFVSLVGPSGCGKSTLLKLITGQEPVQTATEFNILGQPVGPPDRKRGIVFQAYSLAEHLTVLDNIMLGLKYQAGVRQLWSPSWRKQVRERAMEYLIKMRLEGNDYKYPRELSGGMRQRAAIAQTLITIDEFSEPEILCMDEPFGALDDNTREDLQIFMLELWEKYKKTIIFVTHDLNEAVFLGSRIIVLSQFWKSDMDSSKQEGSRIVFDQPLDPHALSTKAKQERSFIKMVKIVRDQGFKPEKRRHVDQFNLSHPDSFQTPTIEESRKNGVHNPGEVVTRVATETTPS